MVDIGPPKPKVVGSNPASPAAESRVTCATACPDVLPDAPGAQARGTMPSQRSEYSPLYVGAILAGYDPGYVRSLSIPEIVALDLEISREALDRAFPFTPHEPEPKLDFWSGTEKTSDGCWIWRGAKRAGYGAVKVDGKVIGCDIVKTDSGAYPPEIADAYLIAAAPDLYEALERLLENECGDGPEMGHFEGCRIKWGKDCDCGIDIARAALAKAAPQRPSEGSGK